jgi:hypothetical protein
MLKLYEIINFEKLKFVIKFHELYLWTWKLHEKTERQLLLKYSQNIPGYS